MADENIGKQFKNLFLFLIFMILFSVFSKKIFPIVEEFFKGKTIAGIIAMHPVWWLWIFSFMLSLIGVLFYKYGIDKALLEKMKDRRRESKEMQEKINQARKDNDMKKMQELQKEMMDKSMQSMSGSFSMMFSQKFIFFLMLPSIALIWFFVGPLYAAAGVGKTNFMPWQFNFPLIGDGGWLFCLILFSFILSIPLRKLFKVEI